MFWQCRIGKRNEALNRFATKKNGRMLTQQSGRNFNHCGAPAPERFQLPNLLPQSQERRINKNNFWLALAVIVGVGITVRFESTLNLVRRPRSFGATFNLTLQKKKQRRRLASLSFRSACAVDKADRQFPGFHLFECKLPRW